MAVKAHGCDGYRGGVSAAARARSPRAYLAGRVALALLAGVALALAFPGYGVWVLAPAGVALLALATRGSGARRGALLGLLCGLVFFTWTLSWSGIYVGALPWLALSVLQALFVAALGAVTGGLSGRWAERPSALRWLPVVVALAWVGQEALRDRVPYGGFPWVRLAFSQADSPLGHLAALGGAPAVTFAVALAGGLLAETVCRVRTACPRPTVAAALLGGAVAVSGMGVLVPLPTDGPPAEVMAVQGNVPMAGLDFNAQRRAVLDNHVTATVDAMAEAAAGTRPKPALVVWPENSSDIDPTTNSDAAAQITRAVTAAGVPLIVGTLVAAPDDRLFNVSLLYTPGVGVTQAYAKQHPVPFAEYIPNRSFFRLFSDKVDLVRTDFAPGPNPVVFDVPSASTASGERILAGPTICFEVAYDDLVRDNVELGANILLVQTNNATFGDTDESVQQLAISRLRAIEHGRSVVHVSTVGVSALITPDGTAHDSSTLFTRDVLSGSLPLRTTTTIATVVGPWPEYAASLALLVILLAQPLIRPRTRPHDPAKDLARV